ncbi:TPA: phosphomannomutase/phosphoglucomutase [Candidatus Woesearchaeota archaeon]|nr:phosphomannomutase/phosphoglucomutase [Candidatus Woesearchaeota archaeon]
MFSKLFKAYDVRGSYPEELDEKAAYLIGKAFVSLLKCGEVVMGRDMRLSSPALSLAFMEGATDMGADVIDIGEVCTDATYFASGKLDLPAVMFTASHNPPHYNGIKFSKAGAVPINEDTGLREMRGIIEKNVFSAVAKKKGATIKKDILNDYVEHVRSFIDEKKLKNMRIAVDAGNGMAGKIVPLVFRGLPIETIPLFFELDGRFPNHLADPSKSENLAWLQDAVRKRKCGFGMAFDGDADRIFFVDEKGGAIHSSLITSLIAKTMLLKYPKSTIIYNAVCGHIVPETIARHGGRPVMERVGHSFIKATMRRTDAVFGGEHSAHYYYRDNYFADSGVISALIMCEVLSRENKPLSELLEEFRVRATLEETNVPVKDKDRTIAFIKNYYQKKSQGKSEGKKSNEKSEEKITKISELDGLTIEFDTWWFNVRPSNTEPLLRLNMEAPNKEFLERKKEEVLVLMRK